MRTKLFACFFIAVMSTYSDSRAIEIETVLIGNAGNSNDTRFMNDGTCCYGGVAYEYRIGKYEVTNDEYAVFLNAIAKNDSYEVYEPSMGTTAQGGIVRSGGVPNYVYTVKPNMGNKPVSWVTTSDAMRFANWLHNGQPSGGQTVDTTENGAYDLTGVGLPLGRSASSNWFLPTGHEWYKAAYYDPRDTANGGPPGNSHYWLYATGSNIVPTLATADDVGNTSNPGFNTATYNAGAQWGGANPFEGNVTTVGSAGPLSASFYGTFDQVGNVWEHNDDIGVHGPQVRTIRGGQFNSLSDAASAGVRGYCGGCYSGLRVASVLNPPIPNDGLDGDYNNDTVVNAADYVVWRDNLGASVALPNDTTSGSVADVDYGVWKANFGAADGAASGHSVPEPTGMALAAIAIILMSIPGMTRRSSFLRP